MRATPGRHFKIVSTVRSTDTYGICQHEVSNKLVTWKRILQWVLNCTRWQWQAVVADYTGARVSVQDRRTGGRIHIGDTRYFRRLCLAHGPEAVPQACGFYAKYDVEGYQGANLLLPLIQLKITIYLRISIELRLCSCLNSYIRGETEERGTEATASSSERPPCGCHKWQTSSSYRSEAQHFLSCSCSALPVDVAKCRTQRKKWLSRCQQRFKESK